MSMMGNSSGSGEGSGVVSESGSAGSDVQTDRGDVRVIVAFGDSLTEGAGVDPAFNYPSRLQAKIDETGYRYRVVNAGISGETTAQGLDRVETMREYHPAIAIVELGANDGLRGLPIGDMRHNLRGIIRAFKDMGATVILAGMEIHPDENPAYASDFGEAFRTVAAEENVALIPFFLEGVGGQPHFNQEDGIHPNAAGYAIVVEHVWHILKQYLVLST